MKPLALAKTLAGSWILISRTQILLICVWNANSSHAIKYVCTIHGANLTSSNMIYIYIYTIQEPNSPLDQASFTPWTMLPEILFLLIATWWEDPWGWQAKLGNDIKANKNHRCTPYGSVGAHTKTGRSPIGYSSGSFEIENLSWPQKKPWNEQKSAKEVNIF